MSRLLDLVNESGVRPQEAIYAAAIPLVLLPRIGVV